MLSIETSSCLPASHLCKWCRLSHDAKKKLKFWNGALPVPPDPDGFSNDKLATMWNGNSEVPSHAGGDGGKQQEKWKANLSEIFFLVYTKIQFWAERSIMWCEIKSEAFKTFKPENMHMATHTWWEKQSVIIKL